LAAGRSLTGTRSWSATTAPGAAVAAERAAAAFVARSATSPVNVTVNPS